MPDFFLILARIISFVFNPIFLLFPLPYLIVYKTTDDDGLALKWLLYSMVFFIVVGLFVLIGVSKKIFTDIDVSKREQRPLLFLFVSILSLFYLSGLLFLKGPPILFAGISGVMLSIILFVFINRHIKASLHVASVASVLITLAIMYEGFFWLLLGLVPLIAWARIKTKRHTPYEALAGGIAGTLLTLLMYTIVEYILVIT
jgi:hypothetical protein